LCGHRQGQRCTDRIREEGLDHEGTKTAKGAKVRAAARALRFLRDPSSLRDPNTFALQRRIEMTDRQIDALVYELPAGEMTPEEIKVVEGM